MGGKWLALEGGCNPWFAVHQTRLFPNLVAGIVVLVLEMSARGAEGGAIAGGNEFDHIANAATVIEEVTAVFFHHVPKSNDRLGRWISRSVL